MNLSLEEFVLKYCVVDYWAACPDIYVLRPRMVWEEGGSTRFDFSPPRGRCIFLDKDERCSIHATKPFECAVSHHAQTWGGRIESLAEAWLEDGWQDRIFAIIGRESPTIAGLDIP